MVSLFCTSDVSAHGFIARVDSLLNIVVFSCIPIMILRVTSDWVRTQTGISCMSGENDTDKSRQPKHFCIVMGYF